MDLRKPVPSGFTLVELLVVIAIIGVFIALLLPAVQAAREAARRSQCMNNLKQISLGMLHYNEAMKHFPPGKITRGPCCDTKSYANWAIEILPYIEQNALFDRYHHKKFNEDPENREVRETLVSLYVCPSEEGAAKLDYPESGPGRTMRWRRGSYRGVTGRSEGNGQWDCDWSSGLPSGWRGVLHAVGTNSLEEEKIKYLIDGLSHTLAFGEGATKTYPSRCTFWAYSYTSYNSSQGYTQSRTLLGDFTQCCEVDGIGSGEPCKRAWGSYHRGIINFALCDGSVQPIQTTISMDSFCSLCGIADRESVSLSEP
ncbi:MAG: DUF1559 domain-containing protein [Pirellulales bacterium]|nr:DUF1559 domain-containing protein [Pirellulales bacterium]